MRRTWKLSSATYVPTVDDVVVANTLAERLRGKDMAETLNNVLEWIEKNVSYWRERGYLIWLYASTMSLYVYTTVIFLMFTAVPLFILSMLILLMITVVLSWHQYSPLLVSIAILFVSASIVTASTYRIAKLLLSSIWQFTRVLLITLSMWTCLIIINETAILSQYLSLLHVDLQWTSKLVGSIGWFTIGVSLFALIYFLSIYSVFYVRNYKRQKYMKVLELIDLTFQPSIPVQKVLEYRLAVCRDYAKLVASILFNLYPDHNIYFLEMPRHVAVAIERDGKLYILDQRLPIMSLSVWMRRRGTKKVKKYLLVKEKEFSIKYVDEVAVEEGSLDLNFSGDLEGLVSAVYSAIKNGQKTLQYILKSYGEIFDIDDPIIENSLERWVRLALEKELVAHRRIIRGVKLSRQDGDIGVNVDLDI